jgi:hypothetical protein
VILGSHGGDYEDGCLLGCSTPMMEAAQTSETSVNSYQSTRRYNPEDSQPSAKTLDLRFILPYVYLVV